MLFHSLRILAIAVALLPVGFAPLFAYASGGGGGAEEGAEAAGPPANKDQKEFQEKTSKLNTLSARIVETEKQFAEVVRAKEHEKQPAEKQKYIKQLVDIATERNKAVADYTRIKTELSLRYPNRGEHLNRRYETQNKKTVEELEGAAGLDELLSRTAKMVKKKFAAFEEPEAEKPKELPKTDAEKDKPKKLRMER